MDLLGFLSRYQILLLGLVHNLITWSKSWQNKPIFKRKFKLLTIERNKGFQTGFFIRTIVSKTYLIIKSIKAGMIQIKIFIDLLIPNPEKYCENIAFLRKTSKKLWSFIMKNQVRVTILFLQWKIKLDLWPREQVFSTSKSLKFELS